MEKQENSDMEIKIASSELKEKVLEAIVKSG